MPTVEVYNGNLEDALAVFKEKVKREGIVGLYKRATAFVPEHEERTRRQYIQERRRRAKEGRR